ncbi:MAG: bi-domain-containing oxidoreductase, partial [Promethearchaeota archaeon]
MKKLFIKSDGTAVLIDIAEPLLGKNGVIVDVHYGLISAGTELDIIKSARNLLIRFLKEKRIRAMAIDIIKRGNVKDIIYYFKKFILKSSTHRNFEPPMPQLKTAGYSCAGIVLKSNVKEIPPGTKIACAGQNHAERVFVPRNLCAPIPEKVSIEEAAFATIGAIALQSIHRACIQPGDLVGVIGTGLIGQIVVQLAKLSGAKVVAFDLIDSRLELAKKMGADWTVNPIDGLARVKVKKITEGIGLDTIIVAASSRNPRPLTLAFELARERGKVVLLGAVPINIPRDHFYMKETDFLISRSYGPGRYDPKYEEEGFDYPIEHVRWTENRNLSLILNLIAAGKLNVKGLITEIVSANNATRAYQKLKNYPAASLAILLDFKSKNERTSFKNMATGEKQGRIINVGLIGCGAFAKENHLPHILAHESCRIKGIATRSKASAQNCKVNYKPQFVTTNAGKIINDNDLELIFIYTRHGSHAKYAIEAMKGGKNVFCEKPMGMNLKECLEVYKTAKATKKIYMIGFNRRMSPHIQKTKMLLQDRKNPIIMVYRVSSPYIPADNWIYDPKDGGGRIIGECCHFFDLIIYLMNSPPVELVARGGALSNKDVTFVDNLSCIITFEDGSIATLIYSDLNAKDLPKERIEIFCGISAIIIDNFQEMKTAGFGAGNSILPEIDKGHALEIQNVIDANLGLVEPFVNEDDAL